MIGRLGRGSLGLLCLAAVVAVQVIAAALGLPLPVVGGLAVLVGVAVLVVGSPGPGQLIVLVGATSAVALRLAGDGLLGAAGLGFAVAVAVITVAAAADEPLARRLAPGVRTVNLPGVRDDPRPGEDRPFAAAVAVAVAVLGLGAAIAAWSGARVPAVTVAVATVVVVGLATVRLWRRVGAIRRGTADRAVRAAVDAWAPEFAVHFCGPIAGEYQLTMWLPYLRQLDRRFVIITRDHRWLARAGALGPEPMLSSPRLSGLDDCMVDSIRAVFHVNTDQLGVDLVRYWDRTQIQLNHGDSDKPSSFHPMIAMFDKIFVAGQAAIDRFSDHGVVVEQSKFVIVGRPQTADIVPAGTGDTRTVLYAPTWRGGTADMSLTSLWSGEQIVATLLELGATVVFRPHPYSLGDKASRAVIARIDALLARSRTPDRDHRTSDRTGSGPIAEWFNRTDALVSDVSSVPVDHLQSGKPLAIAMPPGAQVGAALAEAAYLLPLDGDLVAGLTAMMGEDPLAEQRARTRVHHLGDIPAEDLVAHFLRAARAAIDTPVV